MADANRMAQAETAIALPWRGARPLIPRWRAVAAFAREAWLACAAFEWVAFSYLGVTGMLLLFFRRNLPAAHFHIALHAGVAAIILALTWAGAHRRVRWIEFARHWYPQLFFLFCFEELSYISLLVVPRWQDDLLIRFDAWLTGVYPTVWLQQFARPALNEFMQAAYISYFFYLTILAGILYFRDERRAFWTVMTCSVSAYTLNYLIAILLPVESPYHALAALHTAELRGGPFTALINLIEHFGRVHGAAFPSSHVSGAFAALYGAWKFRRQLFWIYLLPYVAMMASTVYGRYHYVGDVFGGLITGAIGCWLGERWMRLRGAVPQENKI